MIFNTFVLSQICLKMQIQSLFMLLEDPEELTDSETGKPIEAYPFFIIVDDKTDNHVTVKGDRHFRELVQESPRPRIPRFITAEVTRRGERRHYGYFVPSILEEHFPNVFGYFSSEQEIIESIGGRNLK